MGKRRPKKRSKAKLKSLANKKALSDWSMAVKIAGDMSCAVCGSTDRVQSHHLIEKKWWPDHKLDPKIGIPVCSKHHGFNRHSMHTNPFWVVAWMEANRPEQLAYVRKICVPEDLILANSSGKAKMTA